MEYQPDKWHYSTWKKNTRLYRIDLCQDIFGNWIVLRTWGSNLSRGAGRSTYTICHDFETAWDLFEKQENRRCQRGYCLLDKKDWKIAKFSEFLTFKRYKGK